MAFLMNVFMKFKFQAHNLSMPLDKFRDFKINVRIRWLCSIIAPI